MSSTMEAILARYVIHRNKRSCIAVFFVCI